MAKRKLRSPRVIINVTPERWNTAVRAASGGCLISDAIKADYPNLTKVETDMASIRASDREAGLRYQWITPRAVAELLLSFDQGWDHPAEHSFRLNGAAKVSKLVSVNSASRVAKRAERLAYLEEAEAAGSLTSTEVHYLAKMRASRPDRPKTHGKTEVVDTDEGPTTTGKPLPKNPTKNPNLLAGRDRHFGQKSARPSEVFRQAVEAAIAEREGELARTVGEASGANDPTIQGQDAKVTSDDLHA